MTNSITLTATSGSAQTWTVPSDCPPGTAVTVECWGAGAAGSGGGVGGGGGGGAYANSFYTITPNDQTNGVSYLLKAGGTAVTVSNTTAGADTSWSTNNVNIVRNNVGTGAVVGGAVPNTWATSTITGLAWSVTAMGIDPITNFSYLDMRLSGTATGSGSPLVGFEWCFSTPGTAPSVPISTQFTGSVYIALTAGSKTNITNMFVSLEIDNTSGGFDQTVANFDIFSTVSSSLQRFTMTGTTAGSLTNPGWAFYLSPGITGAGAVDATFRIAGAQIEQAAAATFMKSTPGYTAAAGGGAPATGSGAGGTTAASTGTTKFAGGAGATLAQLGGGGGSAGAAGAGGSSTTATGGTADNGSGGAAGVSNVEGGGGGSGSATVGGTAGSAGSPGGGGGGETGASGTRTSGSGGRGQIRLTYAPSTYTNRVGFLQQLQPILAQ